MGKLAKLSQFLDKDHKEISKPTLALFFLSMVVIFLCGFIAGNLVGGISDANTNEVVFSSETPTVEKKIAPKMTYFGEANDVWHYYVDEETDVLYIAMSATNSSLDTRYGLTVAFNADGTPMTRAQLLED